MNAPAPNNDKPEIKNAFANVINRYPGWTLFLGAIVLLNLIGRIGAC